MLETGGGLTSKGGHGMQEKRQNYKSYLIGPEYYHDYIWIIRIVLICVGVSAFVSELIGYDYNSFHVIEFIIELIVDVAMNMAAAFGVVTVIFIILEKKDVKLGKEKGEELQVESKKRRITRGDAVAGIIFELLFFVIIVFVPKMLGAYVFEEGSFVRTIPIFNMNKWNVICPFFIIAFVADITDEIVKLVVGCYCKMVLICNVITNGISLTALIIVFKFMPVWNSEFANEVYNTFGFKMASKGDLLHYWGTDVVSNVVLAVACTITCLDVGITVYKSI